MRIRDQSVFGRSIRGRFNYLSSLHPPQRAHTAADAIASRSKSGDEVSILSVGVKLGSHHAQQISRKV